MKPTLVEFDKIESLDSKNRYIYFNVKEKNGFAQNIKFHLEGYYTHPAFKIIQVSIITQQQTNTKEMHLEIEPWMRELVQVWHKQDPAEDITSYLLSYRPNNTIICFANNITFEKEGYSKIQEKLLGIIKPLKTSDINYPLYLKVNNLISFVDMKYGKTKSTSRKNELTDILYSTYLMLTNPSEKNMAAYLKFADEEDIIFNNTKISALMGLIAIALTTTIITLAVIINPLIALAIPLALLPCAWFLAQSGGPTHFVIYERMHELCKEISEDTYIKASDFINSSISFFGGNSIIEPNQFVSAETIKMT